MKHTTVSFLSIALIMSCMVQAQDTPKTSLLDFENYEEYECAYVCSVLPEYLNHKLTKDAFEMGKAAELEKQKPRKKGDAAITQAQEEAEERIAAVSSAKEAAATKSLKEEPAKPAAQAIQHLASAAVAQEKTITRAAEVEKIQILQQIPQSRAEEVKTLLATNNKPKFDSLYNKDRTIKAPATSIRPRQGFSKELREKLLDDQWVGLVD